MTYQVFDGTEPAEQTGECWANSKFEKFEDAAQYAMDWLGEFYAPDSSYQWKINVPFQYGRYGNFVIIKNLTEG